MSFFTNNDIEGWHNGLNKCASGRAQKQLYMLVHLLHKEAYLVAHQVRLASKRKLQNYHSIHGKISSYWEQYAFHQNSAAQLLKACSHVNGPIVQKLNMIRDKVYLLLKLDFNPFRTTFKEIDYFLVFKQSGKLYI